MTNKLMRRTSYAAHTDKNDGKFMGQLRRAHERRATFDFILPAQVAEKPTFKLNSLLNGLTTARKSSPFSKRPFSSANKKSSFRPNPQKSEDAFDTTFVKEMKSVSSTSVRYKPAIKPSNEDSFEFLVSRMNKDKLSNVKVFKAVLAREPTKDMTELLKKRVQSGKKMNNSALIRSPQRPMELRHRRRESNPPGMDIFKIWTDQPQKQMSKSFVDNKKQALRYGHRTKKGYAPSNPAKCNQDSFIICTSINGLPDHSFFGVCDGHGAYGHHVSNYIKHLLPSVLNSLKIKDVRELLEKTYEICSERLIEQSNIDLTFSGSTSVGCVISSDKVWCSNLGDSRAIIGRKVPDRGWEARQISRDHKPNLQDEALRISTAGGRVLAFKDANGKNVGPLRVWVDGEQYPGLAMTRSFGDLVAQSVGVSCRPEIKQFGLDQHDKFMVIASDGVWQFLQNDHIVRTIGTYWQTGSIDEACEWLLDAAHTSWTKQCSVVDDITFIVIFLNNA